MTPLNKWSPEAATYTTHNIQHTKQTNIHTLSGIRNGDRAISNLRLRPQGHHERSVVSYGIIISQYLSVKLNGISFIIKLEVTVHAFRDFRGSYTSVLYFIFHSFFFFTFLNMGTTLTNQNSIAAKLRSD